MTEYDLIVQKTGSVSISFYVLQKKVSFISGWTVPLI